jgi:DNA-binding LytR/AlgR family response regulator
MNDERFDIHIPLVLHNNGLDKEPSTFALLNTSEPLKKNELLTLSFDEFQIIVDFLKNKILDSHKNIFADTPTFMIATATGFRILNNSQIFYFKYEKQNKQWVAVLKDKSEFFLKRKTTSEDIINYSHSFARINQQQIINLRHLKQIEGNCCVMNSIIDEAIELVISRSYLKELINRFKLI